MHCAAVALFPLHINSTSLAKLSSPPAKLKKNQQPVVAREEWIPHRVRISRATFIRAKTWSSSSTALLEPLMLPRNSNDHNWKSNQQHELMFPPGWLNFSTRVTCWSALSAAIAIYLVNERERGGNAENGNEWGNSRTQNYYENLDRTKYFLRPKIR